MEFLLCFSRISFCRKTSGGVLKCQLSLLQMSLLYIHVRCEWEICMGIYICKPKVTLSHCEGPHRLYARYYWFVITLMDNYWINCQKFGQGWTSDIGNTTPPNTILWSTFAGFLYNNYFFLHLTLCFKKTIKLYSQTPLVQTLRGQEKVSVLKGLSV